MVAPPIAYQNLLDGYFPPVVSGGQAISSSDIWSAFVAMYGISPTTDFDNGTVDLGFGKIVPVKDLFNQFVTKAYNDFQIAGLSDADIKNRHLVFTVMDILILLMKASQDNAAILQNTLLFLAKAQDQYTKQMSSIGFYRGGSSDTGTVNLNNLSEWTLGYANISMSDYLLSAITPRLPDPSTQDTTTGYQELTITADHTTLGVGPAAPHADIDLGVAGFPPISGQIYNNSLSFLADDVSLNITLNVQVPQYNATHTAVNNLAVPITKIVSFPPGATVEQKLDAAQTGLQELFAQNSFTSSDGTQYFIVGKTFGDYASIPAMVFHVPWDKNLNRPYNLQNSGTTAQLKGSEARASKNQLLQQFAENARTRREVLANTSDTERTTMNSAQESVSRSAQIINSTLKQLTNILTSIFKIA